MLFGLIGITAGAAQCEDCPAGIFHCETFTESDPPPSTPEYNWVWVSGPGYWTGYNGLDYRKFQCDGSQQATWTGKVILYPGGTLDDEPVGGTCYIMA